MTIELSKSTLRLAGMGLLFAALGSGGFFTISAVFETRKIVREMQKKGDGGVSQSCLVNDNGQMFCMDGDVNLAPMPPSPKNPKLPPVQ